jgi:hypothetical protein
MKKISDEWKVISGFKKYIGLMFKLSSPKLLFIFDKPTTAPIHSFFCRKFKATWYDTTGCIIDSRIIQPFVWDIKVKKPYCFLAEEILDA